jgi:hypothetical protein
MALGICALLGLALFAFVDLTPEVEADFFFSTDDPQLQGARTIERQFGSAPQIFIAAQSESLFSPRYLQRIRGLTEDFRRLKGVLDIRSLTRGPDDLEAPGGKGANAAVAAARLGARTAIVGRVEHDIRGRALIDHLTRAGCTRCTERRW